MFDLGAQELIVIFVVALLVFGPKRLPELARTMGKGIGQLKKAVFDIKTQVDAEISGVEGDIKEHIPAWKDVASKFPDLAAERDALRDSLSVAGESRTPGDAGAAESKNVGDDPQRSGKEEGGSREENPPASSGQDAPASSDAYADEHHAVETDETSGNEPPPRENGA